MNSAMLPQLAVSGRSSVRALRVGIFPGRDQKSRSPAATANGEIAAHQNIFSVAEIPKKWRSRKSGPPQIERQSRPRDCPAPVSALIYPPASIWGGFEPSAGRSAPAAVVQRVDARDVPILRAFVEAVERWEAHGKRAARRRRWRGRWCASSDLVPITSDAKPASPASRPIQSD